MTYLSMRHGSNADDGGDLGGVCMQLTEIEQQALLPMRELSEKVLATRVRCCCCRCHCSCHVEVGLANATNITGTTKTIR